MKKIFTAVALAICMSIPVLSQSSATDSTPIWDHGDNVSELSYRSVPIYKVYDQKDAYIVLYEKQGYSVGRVEIPKRWASGKEGRKLFFRNRAPTINSYMSVFYKNGEFYKVMLTVSPKRTDAVWAVAPDGTQVNADISTLNIEF